ncbi:DUF485 domain-containing protein [Streptomyces sp. MBT65]|uniref:DUF485 domain-containing protein n=1 Tax=Streptomyces sp. MBT65 TaxID=1488395 RepID=UPI00190A83E7|nr:DUF485 domain-containing protein [Streptomyces sp. MBT65]MBK3581757.1 DUF485 domain-containing protein [Streptomyces sp. MBT65]
MSSDSSELRPLPHRAGRHASSVAPGWAVGRVRPWTGPHRDLRLLRRACRWQRRVAALAALGYFAVFLTLTVRMPSLMGRPAPGGLPFGLVLALVQLPVTWLAVVFYELTARRFVDPLARRVQRQGRDGEWRP